MVVPPIGPSPSRDGTPAPEVVFASEAPPVAHPSDRTRVRPRPGWRGPPASLHLPLLHQPVPSLPISAHGHVGHGVRVRDRLDGPAASAKVRLLRRTHVDLEHAPFGDDVRTRPSMHDTDVPPVTGQRPFSACRRDRLVRRLEDRAPAALGLDTGVRRAALDLGRTSSTPLREETMSPFSRAPSSTSAASARPASARIVFRGTRGNRSLRPGCRCGDLPKSSSRRLQDLDREEARQGHALHVRDTRPERPVALGRERALGDGPGVEHGVRVPDHQDPFAAAALEDVRSRVLRLLLPLVGFVPYRSTTSHRARTSLCTSSDAFTPSGV